jgi:hypothetical protein
MPTSTEDCLRSRARRQGYALRKARTQVDNHNNFGHYMLVEAKRNFAVLGARFDATLEDIETFLK